MVVIIVGVNYERLNCLTQNISTSCSLCGSAVLNSYLEKMPDLHNS